MGMGMIYLRPPRCSNSTPFWGPVSLLGGQAPPGVRVILTLVRCPSRSLKMSLTRIGLPIDVLYTAPSRVISEILNVENYRDLEIQVKRSLKVIASGTIDRLGIPVFYSSLLLSKTHRF